MTERVYAFSDIDTGKYGGYNVKKFNNLKISRDLNFTIGGHNVYKLYVEFSFPRCSDKIAGGYLYLCSNTRMQYWMKNIRGGPLAFALGPPDYFELKKAEFVNCGFCGDMFNHTLKSISEYTESPHDDQDLLYTNMRFLPLLSFQVMKEFSDYISVQPVIELEEKSSFNAEQKKAVDIYQDCLTKLASIRFKGM